MLTVKVEFPRCRRHAQRNAFRRRDARPQSRSFVIRVYDDAGNVIETREHTGNSKNGEASLQHQTHRELMDRPLQFHKGRQFFIGADDECFS